MGKKNTMPALGDQYLQWLSAVPEDRRHDLARKLIDNPVQDSSTFAAFVQEIIFGLIAGDLAPDVAREVRGFSELLYTAVATQEAREHGDSPGGTYRAIFGAIVEMEDKAKQIRDHGTFSSPIIIDTEAEKVGRVRTSKGKINKNVQNEKKKKMLKGGE